MTDLSGVVLIDTNVLLRFFEPGHTQHAAATAAIATVDSDGGVAVVVPQVVYEFWVVATRPQSGNGLGCSPREAAGMVADILSIASLEDDTPEVFGKWLTLVETHAVRGKPAHDARLAAAAHVHGVDTVLTFNAGDFGRYGLTVRVP